MKISAKLAQWVALAFFAGMGGLVFQQIATSMAEQGIASGGPYDNAASYPRSIAILMLVLLAAQLVRDLFLAKDVPTKAPTSPLALSRPIGLIVVFAIYLFCLDWLGYYLSTAPLAAAVMWLCGARKITVIIASAVCMDLVLALVFEKILNVVLPIGVLGVRIPW